MSMHEHSKRQAAATSSSSSSSSSTNISDRSSEETTGMMPMNVERSTRSMSLSTSFEQHHDDETDGLQYTAANGNTINGNSHTNSSNERSLLKLMITAAATSATLGYDVGIMAAAIQPLEAQMDLNGIQKEVAMGSLNFVAALGALFGGRIADAWGRKAANTVCSWIFIVGTLTMTFAWNYSLLLLGRIVTGLGVGVAFVVAPLFISEVAPAHQRGQLNTVFDVAINGGILAGYVSGFVIQVASPDNWRLMLGCGLVLPIIALALISTLPESPRWLMLVHQKPAALAVLQRLGNSTEQAQETIAALEAELEMERQHKTLSLSSSLSSSSKRSGCYWSQGQRIAIGLGFWQQITGTEAVLYYSADFLAEAGLTSPTKRLLGNVFVGICKLVPEMIAMQYVDIIGRRPLLLGSAVALLTSTASLSLAFAMDASAMVVVILLCLIMASFSAGLGPFTFLCAGENLGVSERATGMTYCAAANRCTSGLVAMSVVSLCQLVGQAGLFGLYAMAGVLSLVFYYWTVPETSGKTLEELSAARTLGQQHQQDMNPNAAPCSQGGGDAESPPPPVYRDHEIS